MSFIIVFGAILRSLWFFLIVALLFFSMLKHIKKRYYPNWKFPDYISIGYADYLYEKYIKRDIQ